MESPGILVCDLDGTLLCHGRATPGLRAFRQRIRQERSRLRLVYATGRSFVSTWDLVAQGTLPVPDAVAPQVGSELWLPPFDAPDRTYERVISRGWDLRTVIAAAAHPALAPQAARFQTPHKVSYLVTSGGARVVRELEANLARAGLEAKVLYSGGRYLDILPARAGKQGAVAHLLHRWGDPPRVLACGDSGNDLDLLSDPRVQGVVVGNASDPELTPYVNHGTVYRSRLPFASGVLDGARHYGFFVPSVSFGQVRAQRGEATA